MVWFDIITWFVYLRTQLDIILILTILNQQVCLPVRILFAVSSNESTYLSIGCKSNSSNVSFLLDSSTATARANAKSNLHNNDIDENT